MQPLTSESTSIPINPRTARPVGYAFVDLATATEAQRAIAELSGKELTNRKVSVQLAQKPKTAAGFNAGDAPLPAVDAAYVPSSTIEAPPNMKRSRSAYSQSFVDEPNPTRHLSRDLLATRPRSQGPPQSGSHTVDFFENQYPQEPTRRPFSALPSHPAPAPAPAPARLLPTATPNHHRTTDPHDTTNYRFLRPHPPHFFYPNPPPPRPTSVLIPLAPHSPMSWQLSQPASVPTEWRQEGGREVLAARVGRLEGLLREALEEVERVRRVVG